MWLECGNRSGCWVDGGLLTEREVIVCGTMTKVVRLSQNVGHCVTASVVGALSIRYDHPTICRMPATPGPHYCERSSTYYTQHLNLKSLWYHQQTGRTTLLLCVRMLSAM